MAVPERPIRFVIAALALTMLATVAARITLALFALELGASAFQVGLLSASNQLPAVLLMIAVGILGDRLGPRWIMFAGAVCAILGLLLVRLLPPGVLFAGAALCGVWSVIMVVLSQMLVGILSAPQQLARTYATFSMAMSTTGFGPLLGGYLIDHLGHAVACAVLAGFAAVVALMLLAAGGMPRGERPGGPRGTLAETLSEPGFWRVMWMNAIVQMAIDLFTFYVPIYGYTLGLSASSIGWILSTAAVASFMVRFGLPRLVAHFGEERLLAYSVALAALAFLLMPLARSLGPLVLIALVYGVAIAGAAPVTAMLMIKRSGKGPAGESMGLRMTGNAAVRIVGPPAFGGLAALAGIVSVFVAAGMLFAAGAGAMMRAKEPSAKREQPARDGHD